MRFLTPLLFAGAGAWVWYYNGHHADSVLLLPMIDVIDPSTAGDMKAQGARSVQILFGLAVAFALWDTAMWLRARNTSQE
ncbi:MAG: hypothetical protein ACOZNI_01285 [Myxococcota bacterium]